MNRSKLFIYYPECCLYKLHREHQFAQRFLPSKWDLANSMVTLQNQITSTINKINAGTPLIIGSVIFVAGLKADTGYYPNINISVDPLPADLTSNDQAAQADVNGLKALHTDYQEIARTKIIVNSKTVWLLEFKATFANTPLMHDYLLVYLLNGNIWTLTCTVTDADFSQFKNDFTVITNSLKINKSLFRAVTPLLYGTCHNQTILLRLQRGDITMPKQLSHVNSSGEARMVDISQKGITVREAVAKGSVIMKPSTLEQVKNAGMKKGDVLAVARVASIMAAKRVPDFIPLCHAISIDSITIDFDLTATNCIGITGTAKSTAKTGVEMEALTAVTVAALTIYDMCKAVEKDMTITDIYLETKTGGKSGTYKRKTK